MSIEEIFFNGGFTFGISLFVKRKQRQSTVITSPFIRRFSCILSCCGLDMFVQFVLVRLRHLSHSKRLQLAPTPFQHTVHFGILLRERKPGPGFVSISPRSITLYVATVLE